MYPRRTVRLKPPSALSLLTSPTTISWDASRDGEASHEIVVGEVKRLSAEGGFKRTVRLGYMFKHQIKKRGQVFGFVGELALGDAFAADGVDHGKITLLVVRAEFKE